MSNNNNTTKEKEQTELHRIIWKMTNDLRGNVNAWDFKKYVVKMLFYRFISENLTGYINEGEWRCGIKDFDYATLPDEKAELGRLETINEKGFYILPSELFTNIRAKAHQDSTLNKTLAAVFRNIEYSAKKTLSGLFNDIDFNSEKLGNTVEKRNQKLATILNAIGNLELGNYYNNTMDSFSNTYESLMTMYASSSTGKMLGIGKFFTPQEVSELLACIVTAGKKEVNKVYDPACGSGSLLLKFAKILGEGNVRKGFFGQDINSASYNLCRLNMLFHSIEYDKFFITCKDTLTDDLYFDEPFDAIVSNPPYSINEGDLAFAMHMVNRLSTSGTAAIVEFPEVLYRGGKEQKARKYLIDNNCIDTVIQLPPDLFFNTNIPTCIMVFRKNKEDDKILFIDASTKFVRVKNKNKLSDESRAQIIETFIKREEKKHFSKLISNKTIEKNEYNIAVSNYVKKKYPYSIIDTRKLNTDINGRYL